MSEITDECAAPARDRVAKSLAVSSADLHWDELDHAGPFLPSQVRIDDRWFSEEPANSNTVTTAADVAVQPVPQDCNTSRNVDRADPNVEVVSETVTDTAECSNLADGPRFEVNGLPENCLPVDAQVWHDLSAAEDELADAELELAFTNYAQTDPHTQIDDRLNRSVDSQQDEFDDDADFLEDGIPAEISHEVDSFDLSATTETFDDFEIADFQPDIQQPLWAEADLSDEAVPRKALEKASAIAALVDVGTRREQEQVLSFLTELFDHLPHSATFRALERTAREGLSPEHLYAMVALKGVWAERSDWWMGRYGYRFEIVPLRRGASALTWVLSGRVCRARVDHSPETMIDEDWFSEWLLVEPGEAGFLSFPDFIDTKIRSLNATFLHDALSWESRLNGHVADGLGWFRQLPQHEIPPGSFRILTPYDDGPGKLASMPIPPGRNQDATK